MLSAGGGMSRGQKGDYMAKFHITIRDNSTGNVVQDCETSCIVGAFHNDDTDDTATLVAANCNTLDLAHTTCCAAQAVQMVQDKRPELAALIAMFVSEGRGTPND